MPREMATLPIPIYTPDRPLHSVGAHVYARDVDLKVGDTLTMVERTKHTKASRSSACSGHTYTIEASWKHSTSGASYGEVYAMSRCTECRATRNVVPTDIIKNVVFHQELLKKGVTISEVKGATYEFVTDNYKEIQSMFTTNTVEVIDGYVGQVIFEGKIVWQSESFPPEDLTDLGDQPAATKARAAATKAKADAVQALFKDVSA